MKKQEAKAVSTTIVILFVTAVVISFFSYTCIAEEDSLDSGLVLHLSFDTIEDISGQKLIVDESGCENHGTLLGGEISEGKVGNALKCFAINKADGVRVKDHDSLDLDAVTMAAWIKTNQIDGQWNRIIDKGWRSAYNLCIGGDYKGQTWRRNRVSIECVHKNLGSKANVVDDQWHFVVGTYDGRTLQLYVDGKLNTEKKLKDPTEAKCKWNQAAPMKHNDMDIMIGQLAVPEPLPHNHAFFDGLIDEVRLYNRVLSEKEVLQLYKMSN